MTRKWIGPVLIGVMILASVLAYGRLPERVPTHWNIAGEVDGYASPLFTAVFGPALAATLWALLWVIGRFDPISQHPSTTAYLQKAATVLAAFLFVVHLALLGIGLGLRLNMVQIVVLAEGALLAVLGGGMRGLRRNSWAGIRVPWTLTDDDIWRRTHQVAARVFVLAGLATIVAALVFNGVVLFTVVLVAALGASLLSVAYSYRLALLKRGAAR